MTKDTKTIKLEGVASLYNTPDDVDDVMLPGCFDDALKVKNQYPMLVSFKDTPPIGVWNVKATDKGLEVEGEMIVTESTREFADRILSGEIRGLSIGYRVEDGDFDVSVGENGSYMSFKKVNLTEVQIVTRPVLKGARITSIDGKPIKADE